MGSNLHTPYVAGSTRFRAVDMNAPLSALDSAISLFRNILVTCDTSISWTLGTNTLAWGNLHIYFMNSAGKTIHNSIAASSATLSDTGFVYVTLNGTNNTALTMAKGVLTLDADSVSKTYSNLILGYRNTADDNIYGILGDLSNRGAILKSLFDAQTILAATTDNTPAALTVPEQTLVGRITGGNIAALTAAQVRTLLGINVLSAVPSVDLTVSGDIVPLTAAQTMAFGDVCRINSVSKAAIADASLVSTSFASFMSIGTLATDASGNFLMPGGFARNDAWNWTPGQPIYLSTTGASGTSLTQTPPSAANEVIQIIGIATHADRMFFNPQLAQVEHV